MDPQQRLLLELTWEALEDGGIPPSSVAGKDVGVYVGGSSLDYGTSRFFDMAGGDGYLATGNALSILSNRISYIFNLKGPSLTIDTACSSSLVALHHAMDALRSGRIDTAVVGGINVLGSPFQFISFSQASMLSPTGLCQAFSSKADGYVRSEGGVVLVLQKLSQARASHHPLHGLIVASDVNSDGRTQGIALPSMDAQADLLERVYSRAGIDPNRLAFVEAHGTGTQVGDPIEATAIGRSLGKSRSHPLLIGSVKTNIGHLEPASGLAGVMKAVMALEHKQLPPSLHFDEPNPHIDFEQLNLAHCSSLTDLPSSILPCAGVNSFGFGGTNAHVIVAPARPAQRVAGDRPRESGALLALSAQSKGALAALALDYADRLKTASDHQASALVSAAAYRRDQLSHRLAVPAGDRTEIATALEAFATGETHALVTSGTSIGRDLPLAFIYSGNGGQHPGMGLSAYSHNEHFRAHLENLDEVFRPLAGWSLREMLLSDRLADELPKTSIAQPLIFAIQSASTAVLRRLGLKPVVVIGHSVGEVAAAEAAGILDLETAVRLIYFRSLHQERVRGHGRMAVLVAPLDIAQQLIDSIPGLEIGAYNSPRAVTVVGPGDAITTLAAIAKRDRIVFRQMDLDYPFHSQLMASVEEPLIEDLADIVPQAGDIPFVSTVTGSVISGASLDATYWWRNVREPVRFLSGLEHTRRLGARCFLELGPRGTLLSHVSDTLDRHGPVATMAVLDRSDREADPFEQTLANVFVRGGAIEKRAAFGSDPGPSVSLPSYPWQRQRFQVKPTSEAFGGPVEIDRHPLCGSRAAPDGLEWRGHVDTVTVPALADHKVGGRVVMPGSGLIEIALTVARQYLQTDHVSVTQFDILQFLDLSEGETREILTRVSPGSNTIEILSRPRLSGSGWHVHARGKMAHADPVDADLPKKKSGAKPVPGEAIYRLAEAAGLQYGPAFRLAQSSIQIDETRIIVELAPEQDKAPAGYHLDPARLDCCFHGLFTLFEALKVKARGVGYVPVRFEEATVVVPDAQIHKALIELITCNERSIVADFSLFDASGQLIAIIHGARFQAVRTRQIGDLESIGLVQKRRLVDANTVPRSGTPASSSDILSWARSAGLVSPDVQSRDDALLLEGWATTVAYELAEGLVDHGVIDVDRLVSAGRIPAELRLWLINALIGLEAAGLAHESDGRWTLTADPMLPDSKTVLAALAAEHPARAAELLLAGEVTHIVKRMVASPTNFDPPKLSTSALEFYELAGLSARESSETLSLLLQNPKVVWPQDRALRILQVGFGPATMACHQIARANEARMTVLEPGRRRFEQARLALPSGSGVEVLDDKQPLGTAAYDLIVAAQELHRLPTAIGLDELAKSLAPGGLLFALEPQPSLFRDLIFGLRSYWFSESVGDFPVGVLRPAGRWKADLSAAGFRNVQIEPAMCGSISGLLIVGEAPPVALADDEQQSKSALIISDAKQRDAEVATTLATLLPMDGVHVSMVLTEIDATPELPASPPPVVIQFLSSVDDAMGSVRAVRSRCMQMKACVERLGAAKSTLWLVFFGALKGNGTRIRPVDTAAWTFARTLANEFPTIDIRRVDIAPHVSPQVAAELMRDVIVSGTSETELVLDEGVVRAIRVEAVERSTHYPNNPPAEAARLERAFSGGQRTAWQPVERTAPADNEIEIAVEATGLNFRDLMWSMSLLPDDILEDGFAGATLGLECSGRVVRVGAAVSKFKEGDQVVALAASAFATHVTVVADAVAKVPDGMTCESAATIPVAFMTAYYSLIVLARLKRGEWVLIHGGAGGVGLAAIQIAQYRGARIIATAGSSAKRDLLSALGVQHVLDSRSTAFVREVKEITGGGVDVVLNSLAGEAMEKGLSTLRPFGRFIELGKRDYVANTHVGLRPFRRNLSYFGVDVDQLMGAQRRLGQKVYAEMMRLFKSGALSPLPYRVFESSEVTDAFRLMQQSGHIGKVVIRPPAPGVIRKSSRHFSIDPRRTHLITGGLGGFGLETARWLVEHGARHLVLVGRNGAATPEAKTALAEFAARGAQVHALACDVTDRREVQKLFETIQRSMPPLAGVIHAAMVLDDALISNLDAERMDRVLAPKVFGADNLDRATRGSSLDYFIMYSSVTTLIGNPGQGNYVAANGYLEGIARRRRQEGLPATAIGFGPISDVGVVSRNQRLATSLKERGGVKGMSARDALDLMAEALAQPGQEIDDAVITIALQDWGAAADRLALLRSPTFATLVGTDRSSVSGGKGTIDLRALVAGGDIENARLKIVSVIVEEIARVLHLPMEDISQSRPLGEIGLDSLMGLELAMGLQDRFGLDIPLSASTGSLTVGAVADQVIAQANPASARGVDPAVFALAETHMVGDLANVEKEQIEAVKDLVDARSKELKRLLD